MSLFFSPLRTDKTLFFDERVGVIEELVPIADE